eukprot:4138422-Prymnesium_polylepis.1
MRDGRLPTHVCWLAAGRLRLLGDGLRRELHGQLRRAARRRPGHIDRPVRRPGDPAQGRRHHA